jgi:ectoine hydroxylase-related dioxygenase (phytanoyl-CoA dioxygenase family)
MSVARHVITDAEAQFFRDNGYLILRGVVQGEELARMRRAMDELTEYGSSAIREGPDFMYGRGHKSGGQVLKRIEYVIDKTEEGKVLLGHPFILRSVEKLMGKDFIPTWDSMVLKMPGEGIVVPWHRDAGTDFVGGQPIFNVDFYMDEADQDTCLWVIPGSHQWSAQQAKARIDELSQDGFRTSGAVPAPMQAGDVIFHNILVLHGSPPNASSKLRRVVYYEFRAAHVEDRIGPHVPAYIPLKQKVLLDCIERRKRAAYIPRDEIPYAYEPPAPYHTVTLASGETLPTCRYAHSEYWRS